LYDCVPPIPPGLKGDLITEPVETFSLSSPYRQHLSLNILGRILHLLADMSVPAHAHNDEHAPRKLWLLDSWHTEYCDEYEGWHADSDKDISAGGFMVFEDNWYWNYLNILAQKGGYIDISMEDDPLYFAMYTVNQIADFFASDDVDGDSDLPQGSNQIIDAIYAELEAQYPPDHPVRNAHEMNDDECALIRDTVFPFVIRATAGLLEWFAQENNLTQYNIPTADTLKGYFYSYTNPVPNPDETNKEISLYYITHNPYDPLISGTIEKEDGEIIWDNSDINLFPCNSVVGYLPSWRFYRRVTVENNYTGPLTIKIYEDGVLTKESTVEYTPSNKPPIPILFSNTTEPKGIYPVNQYNTYCSQLYYAHPYTLKLNAPYQGDIDTWYNIMIEDDGEHTYPLNNTSCAQFNDDGTVDLYIPSMDEIIDSGLTAGNVRLKINDVEGWYNHRIICNSDAFNGLISTISYPGIIWYLIKQYTPGTGCPSIYIDDEYFNNILPLSENQDIDQFDYIILDKSTMNPGKTDFQIREDQSNKNYLDMLQLVGVGHSKDVEIGVNNSNGYIFPYSTKSLIKYSGKDSIITITADDSILLYLDDFNIPPVDLIYLKVTSSLISNKYHDPSNINKGDLVAGTNASKDTTGIDTLDVIGLHEEYYTSFTDIYSYEINFSNGVISLKPSRDIQISEITIIPEPGGKEEIEIINIPIKEAVSLQNRRNVTVEILRDDDLYFEFAKDDGVRFFFDMPSFRSEEVDYLLISNGRYNHIEEELINNLEISHYPNPFSNSTTISFSLPKNVEKATLKIYNLKGQLVKTYKLDSEDTSITWDGKNNNGLQVANGIYFYKLTCNNKSVVKKMIFLR